MGCCSLGRLPTLSHLPSSHLPSEVFLHLYCWSFSLQVRSILEAQQEFKKNNRQLKRAKSSASLPGSQEQAACLPA